MEALDTIDIQILRELQDDGRLSIVDLAQRVGLSPSPCLRRVRSLEERGIILGYRALLDPNAIGLGLQFIVSFKVNPRDLEERQAFRKTVVSFPEVISLYGVTGDVDGIARVAVPSFGAYEHFLEQKLWPLPIKDVLSRYIIKPLKRTAAYDLSHIEAVPPAAQPAPPRSAPRRKRKRAAKAG